MQNHSDVASSVGAVTGVELAMGWKDGVAVGEATALLVFGSGVVGAEVVVAEGVLSVAVV